jgi:hypothetical protein
MSTSSSVETEVGRAALQSDFSAGEIRYDCSLSQAGFVTYPVQLTGPSDRQRPSFRECNSDLHTKRWRRRMPESPSRNASNFGLGSTRATSWSRTATFSGKV